MLSVCSFPLNRFLALFLSEKHDIKQREFKNGKNEARNRIVIIEL